MRITRFVSTDGQESLGRELDDGRATPVSDPLGLLDGSPATALLGRRLSGLRAIVADDDEGMRETVCRVLEKFSCETLPCRDGAEALSAIEGEQVDLVVSDIAMPHYNGYEVFSAARNRSERMPVVLITGFGYDPNHSLVRASKDGLSAALFKPFTPQQLVDEICKAIRGSAQPLSSSFEDAGAPVEVTDRRSPLRPHRAVEVVSGDSRQAGGVRQTRDLDQASFVESPGGLPVSAEGGEASAHLAIVIGMAVNKESVESAARSIVGLTLSFVVRSELGTRWALGPIVATADEIPAGSSLIVRINGDRAREVSVPPEEDSLGRLLTEVNGAPLTAADVVLPPALSGALATAPSRVKPGDTIEVELTGLGTLSREIIAG